MDDEGRKALSDAEAQDAAAWQRDYDDAMGAMRAMVIMMACAAITALAVISLAVWRLVG